MNPLINALVKLGILTEDLDYHLIRASMVIIFFFFGYQKWWAYEAERLIPYQAAEKWRELRLELVFQGVSGLVTVL